MQRAALSDWLLAVRDAGGGWPYYRGRHVRIEPTCWALLALRPTEMVPIHVATLRALQADDGWLRDPGTPEVNYAWNGLAALTLQAVPGGAETDVFERLLPKLVETKGVQLGPEHTVAIPQNGRLQAWSWTAGTFSWVEPSAYALLALKVLPDDVPGVSARIPEAEAVLFDRVCPAGGWNYGNSVVLGQDLRPYVPTTALGLLALQDRRDHPAVVSSLDWLEANALSERSAMALSLAALALFVFARPVGQLLDALIAQHSATGFLDNAHLVAMALYALTVEAHGARAFRVGNGRAAVGESRP